MSLPDALLTLYPVLGGVPDAATVLDGITPIELPAGYLLFTEGQPCQGFPLVLSGAIRVYKQAENGREMPLYRVLSGESCIVTSSCLVSGVTYNARGITEAPTQVLVLPAQAFADWLAYPAFRDYVLALFADRIGDLMQRVEEVAFHRLDARLAGALLGHGRFVHATHAQLANELGSVREMVSRLLKGFEVQGLVALSREQVEILDPAGLRRICEGR
jgi:CRP/FNR family transcriptional regulator